MALVLVIMSNPNTRPAANHPLQPCPVTTHQMIAYATAVVARIAITSAYITADMSRRWGMSVKSSVQADTSPGSRGSSSLNARKARYTVSSPSSTEYTRRTYCWVVRLSSSVSL